MCQNVISAERSFLPTPGHTHVNEEDEGQSGGLAVWTVSLGHRNRGRADQRTCPSE